MKVRCKLKLDGDAKHPDMAGVALPVAVKKQL